MNKNRILMPPTILGIVLISAFGPSDFAARNGASAQDLSLVEPETSLFEPEKTKTPHSIDKELKPKNTFDTPNEERASHPQGQSYPTFTTQGGFRPVPETTYRDETFQVQVPVVEDGKTRIVTELRTRRVPVTTTRMVPDAFGSRYQSSLHSPETWKLVGQAVESEDSETRERVTAALRDRLVEEFRQQLASQADRIAELEEELEKLKNLHKGRERDRDAIVDRRLRELTTGTDPLAWGHATPIQRMDTTVTFPREWQRVGSPVLPAFDEPATGRATIEESENQFTPKKE